MVISVKIKNIIHVYKKSKTLPEFVVQYFANTVHTEAIGMILCDILARFGCELHRGALAFGDIVVVTTDEFCATTWTSFFLHIFYMLLLFPLDVLSPTDGTDNTDFFFPFF